MEGKKSELIHNPYGGPHLLHGNNTTANNQAPNHHSHHHNSSIHHSLSQAHHNHHHHNIQRTSPTNSLGGSSGVSSPGTGETESYYANGNRQTLAYVPGSVHQASYAPPMQQGNVRVKQEPSDGDYARGYNAQNNNNNNNSAPYSNGTVSSTTPSPPSGLYMPGAQGLKVLSSSNSSHLPSSNKYIHPSLGTKKKTAIGVRCSDEYRRRRERNNVAVRKSREKAKIRTRETEERVKILARENERLTKKVELLQEELSVLRSLFSNVGVLPDHIHRELSKHMDSFQAQHNAMAATGNM
ncbi:Uncharacterized protein FKW44_003315 [Caligus rogercresseyi]|uniref:BZIP domain-containing protein n=1 Tax=Caligus rogercresseyi TaxID=217165 RepID=A0A7T8QWY6_CALRO|nr:Uncharacterized protein FKW44_003315 [Caligus rogercresseyi]